MFLLGADHVCLVYGWTMSFWYHVNVVVVHYLWVVPTPSPYTCFQVLCKCSVAVVLCDTYILPHNVFFGVMFESQHISAHVSPELLSLLFCVLDAWVALFCVVSGAIVHMSLTTTHTKLRMLHLDSSDSTVLQTHFHTLLLQAIVGEAQLNGVPMSCQGYLQQLRLHYRTSAS